MLAVSPGEAGHSAKCLPCFTPLLDWDLLLSNMYMKNVQTGAPKLQSSGSVEKGSIQREGSLQHYTEQPLFMRKLDRVSKTLS